VDRRGGAAVADQQPSGTAPRWTRWRPCGSGSGRPPSLFVPAFAAGSAGRSFRAGLQAGIWAGIAALPLAYALWLHEALRLYAINGRLLWFVGGAPEGENLSAALFWALQFTPLLGLPFAAIGAAIGAGAAGPPAAQAQHAVTTAKP